MTDELDPDALRRNKSGPPRRRRSVVVAVIATLGAQPSSEGRLVTDWLAPADETIASANLV